VFTGPLRSPGNLKNGSGRSSDVGLISIAILILCGFVYGWRADAAKLSGIGGAAPSAAELQQPGRTSERTKVAEGEYAILESANNGAVGPFKEEIYNFHEAWTLWRTEEGGYRVEGLRRFESPKDLPHNDRFAVELSRDLTVMSLEEFAKLRWVPDSGPLSCQFLPSRLRCSSGGSAANRAIELDTQLTDPYGILWPVSPFSLSGVTRQIERDPAKATQVDLVTIEQPDPANPVQTTVLAGPLRYLGKETIEAAGRKWQAQKFSLKVALLPEFLIWTSERGILLALAFEHEHKNWPEEGLRLVRYRSGSDF